MIPGSGMLTRLALDTMAVAETSRHFPVLDDMLGIVESRQGGGGVNELTLFVMVLVGMLLAPAFLSYYGWDQLNIVNNNSARSMSNGKEVVDPLEEIAAKVQAALAGLDSKEVHPPSYQSGENTEVDTSAD